ncbi:MAG: phosphate signaling complex protein PhoU [Oscillospiraceae bacterium]|nr:phosphate signaling complex protein PhoU [Oscillospiraceae bacterium]
MRSNFDEQLNQLNGKLVEMGAIVERAIADASKALIEQDEELAQRVIENDDNIDDMEDLIEDMCQKIIMRQQPIAGDLRLILAVSKIIVDLERIGDHASDISELAIFLAEGKSIGKLEHIPQMAEATLTMVTRAIDAFVRSDLELAKDVIDYDDVVDDLFTLVKEDAIRLIKSDIDQSSHAIDLIMIAKYFERIGDHATNVAEWVVFSMTGENKHGIAGRNKS